jgi:hypothetical protein
MEQLRVHFVAQDLSRLTVLGKTSLNYFVLKKLLEVDSLETLAL